MAKGSETAGSTKKSVFTKKIACQFTPEQFAQVNTVADAMGIPFAAAVRFLIFHRGPFPHPTQTPQE